MAFTDPHPPSLAARESSGRPPISLNVVREPDALLRHAAVDWSSWYLTDEEDEGEAPEWGEIIRLLLSLFQTLVSERGWAGVYAGSDNFFGWIQAEPLVRLSPDVYLLPRCPDPMPKSFETWREGVSPPSVAVEVVSEDWQKDYALAPEKYHHLGVQELIVCDPDALDRPKDRVAFQVFRRTGDGLFVRVAAGDGPVWSEVLSAAFIFAPSERFRFVRLTYDEAGQSLVPTPSEAHAEHAQRESERAQREAEHAARESERADHEAERAAAAERELAALRAELIALKRTRDEG